MASRLGDHWLNGLTPSLTGGVRFKRGLQKAQTPSKPAEAQSRGDDASGNGVSEGPGHHVTTYNGSGLRSLKRFLTKTGSLIVAAQETGIAEALAPEMEDWCASRGWRMLHSAAIPSASEQSRGATSAGVAVFVRDSLGLRWPELGEGRGIVFPGRAMQVIVELSGWPPLGVACSYLFSGEGLSRNNLKLMAAMGSARGPNSPDLQIWAADWNMSPDLVDLSGLPVKLRASIVTCGSPTCVTAKSANEIDFFLVTSNVTEALHSAAEDRTWPVRPHRPVSLVFKQGVLSLKRLVFKTRHRLPTAAPFGPRPRPSDWTRAKALGQLAVDASTSLAACEADAVLDRAWSAFANTAEQEIMRVTGASVRRPGLLGCAAEAVWEAVIPRKHDPSILESVCDGWHWIDHCLDSICNALMLQDEAEDADVHAGGATLEGDVLASIEHGAVPGNGLCERLSKAVDALVSLAQQLQHHRSSAPTGQWLSEAQALHEEFKDDIAEVKKKAADEDSKSWADLVDKAFSRGSKGMHRLCKLREGWSPTLAVLDRDSEGRATQITAELSAVLSAETNTLAECWRASDSAPRACIPDRCTLGRIAPDAIRSAALSFVEGTAYSTEGLHPRHVALLDDAGLVVLSLLLEAIERLGVLPRAIRLLVFVLIPKPKGGFRPVLQQPMVMRLWERLRRNDIVEFMLRTHRSYYAFAAGQACSDVVWRQTARAEAALQEDEEVAAFTCDAQKFYEQFDLQVLRMRALAFGMPSPIVKLTYNTWRSPRMLRQGRQLHDRILFAKCGLPAGSGLNDCFVRAYCTAPLDSFTLRCPGVTLDQAIDDSVLIAHGTASEVRRKIVAAVAELEITITVDLNSTLADGKTAVSASSGKLALEIAKDLRRLGPSGNGFVNLGVDFRIGKAGGPKARARRRNATLRRRRIDRVSKWLPNKKFRMISIVRTGLKPAVAYGAAVHGLTDREWHWAHGATAGWKSSLAQRGILILETGPCRG